VADRGCCSSRVKNTCAKEEDQELKSLRLSAYRFETPH
jgi:hypothetical protein